MVEIVVRKTASKRTEKSSSSESHENECVIEEDEELPEPASVIDNDTSIIDVNGYDLTLDSLIRLG